MKQQINIMLTIVTDDEVEGGATLRADVVGAVVVTTVVVEFVVAVVVVGVVVVAVVSVTAVVVTTDVTLWVGCAPITQS